jgi:ABC-type transporter Mla subunit MlaD
MTDRVEPGQSPDATDADAESAVPVAALRMASEVKVGRLRTRLWWLTGVCVLVAISLVVSSLRSQGTRIVVHFQDGYGLKAGDTLRYRGIDVGEVTSVTIASELSGVDVKILLAPGNESIGVEGSQFWIERARLRIGQISGLDTLLGAKYVGVIPGDSTAAGASEFVGIETPLAMTGGESTEIRIQFPAGEGLEVGDQIRFRGIAVGEVSYVELNDGLESVAVGARLVGASGQLARAGTQFWIERPRLDLTEIRGLETLIGGRYIAMQPTSTTSDLRTEFIGLAEPPPLPRRDGSLEIELDASRRLGLVRGAPITYRGLEVGRVANVGLASDSASVKVGAIIDAEYADLVRTNTKWWAVGGIEFDASLSGVHVSIESLSSWIRGGVAFATPLSPGERVVTGHRFMLEPDPMPEWLEWQPRIVARAANGAGTGNALPEPIRVVASWQASWLGLYRRRTLESWGIALDDHTLQLPANFIADAVDTGSDVLIEVSGKSFALEAALTKVQGAVAALSLPDEVVVAEWATQDIDSRWSRETVLLIVNPELSEPLAVDATRISDKPGIGLAIAPGVAISPPLNGSPVVNSVTGKLFGLLMESDEGWLIGQLSAQSD